MPQRLRDPGPLEVLTGRRDWGRILRELAQTGVSMKEVARKIGRDPSTVQGWAAGSEPRECDGRMVLALHARHCPAQYLEHQRQYEIPAPGLTARPGAC